MVKEPLLGPSQDLKNAKQIWAQGNILKSTENLNIIDALALSTHSDYNKT